MLFRSRLNETWTVGQPRGLQGQSVWGSPVGRTKQRFQTLLMQTVRDSLWGRSVHHYRGNPPQLRYTPTADAASHCRGNPLQQRDSAAGHSPWQRPQQNSRARASVTTAGRSLGRQTVASLRPSWAGHLNRHPKIKPETPNTDHLRKKGFFLMSSVAAKSYIAA